MIAKMLNEERVILMTRMASYEGSAEGKQNMKIGHYFRSDYLALQLLKSLASATIAFAVVFALYIFYDFEVFMQNLYEIDLIAFIKKVILYYGIITGVYLAATYAVCTYRYAKAKRSLKSCYHNLKRLNFLYDEQQ